MPEAQNYPDSLRKLLDQLPLAPLGPGKPMTALRSEIIQAERELQQGTSPESDRQACRAGLWLAFDFLDESHTISQNLETVEGSFWHAIMHRREPDAANSKYWFRRVGEHPVLDQLRERAPSLGYKFTDPFAFVDFVERVRDTGTADEELARRVQRLEWELLFAWCWRSASGG